MHWPAVLGVFLLVVSGLCRSVQATPPEYATFERDQDRYHTPAEDDLLRIWVAYVGQGDGILIQLPESYGYTRTGADGTTEIAERIDILIDGGSHGGSNAWRMLDLIQRLYPDEDPIIEYAVITHHDADHVRGLTHLLVHSEIRVETIFHNGLASYRGGADFDGIPDFPQYTKPADAICDWDGDEVKKAMAYLEDDGVHLREEYYIESLADLLDSQANGRFCSVYEELAVAIEGRQDSSPVQAFERAHVGSPFIAEWEASLDRGVSLDGMAFRLLWPLEQLQKYTKAWDKTINGNSITFRLEYDQFEMLFTGDLNKHSQDTLLVHYSTAAERESLTCDVLKVPHHGSDDYDEEFLKLTSPVLSVVSMGQQGFRSGALTNNAWEHPSTELIDILGRSHRVYHTFIHERRFEWPELDTWEEYYEMHEDYNGGTEEDPQEYRHVLVETDGDWFRFVEAPEHWPDYNEPPTITQTRRGNGTRWVRAQE